MVILKKKIKAKINEVFTGIQGEGQNTGKPSVFIRFFGCNLYCEYCDSKYAIEGQENNIYTICELVREIKQSKVRHIVFTGGEPLLQQEYITEVIKELKRYEVKSIKYTFEIETNGCISMLPELRMLIDYINISVKLESSKQKYNTQNNARVNYKALHTLIIDDKYNNNVSFKFVITKKTEVEDISEALLIRNNFMHTKVYVMPEGTISIDVIEGMKKLIPYCIKFNLHLSPRLQVIMFGKKRGV